MSELRNNKLSQSRILCLNVVSINVNGLKDNEKKNVISLAKTSFFKYNPT